MKRDYVVVMFEEIRDQNKAVLEAVGMMQDKMETLATKADLKVVADDVAWIKLALTDTNKDARNHDIRITRLERRLS